MDESNIPVELELRDDVKNDECFIRLKAGRVDGLNTSNKFGLEINLKDGSFKLLDGDGYGIVSDGSGNFTWHHESVNFSEGTTDSL